MQCSYKESCRPVMLNRLLPPVPQPPPMQSMNPAQVVPLPNRPFAPPPPLTMAPSVQPSVFRPVAPMPVNTTASAAYPYVQPVSPAVTMPQAFGGQFLDTRNPNPVAGMYRPGAQAQPYYFTQYPGEKVGNRLAKNLILRMLEVAFQELANFFRHFTWPPNR
jgi:hypothetical protein